jgi:beta-lactamase regulating signal transducer with metallopeptidase domain
MNLPVFQHSVFLQSLGWAIANNIWQCGVLWLLYQIAVASYNHASAKFKNNLCTLLLFSNFLWFITTFLSKITDLSVSAEESNIVGGLIYYNGAALNSNATAFQKIISNLVTTLPYLSIAYILLLLIFVIKLVNSYRNIIFIKNNGLSRPNAEWKVFVENVANHINLNKKIKIWFSRHVDVPATIGFLKPVILIPLASLNQLTTDQMEAIILHEISHIKRNDYLVNLLVSIIETILFFNPFVVLLTKIINKERENCCDDFVLQYQYDRHSYASALLMLEQSRAQQFHLALAATSGKQQLLFRIKRIMEVKSNSGSLNYGQKLLALLLSTGIICSIAWLTPEKKPNQNAHQLQSQSQSPKANNKPLQKAKELTIKEQVISNINTYIKPLIQKNTLYNTLGLQKIATDHAGSDETTFTNKPTEGGRGGLSLSSLFGEDQPKKSQAPNITNNDLAFLANPTQNFAFLKNLKVNIDVKKLKEDILKSGEVLSDLDWADINKELKKFEAISFSKLKLNMPEKRAQFHQQETNKETETQQSKFERLFNSTNEESNLFGVDTFFFKDDNNNGVTFSSNETPDHKLSNLSASAGLYGKKIFKVNPPVVYSQANPYMPGSYSYQYSTAPEYNELPNENLLPPTTALIKVDGVNSSIVINGEKICLAKMNKRQYEKIIKNLISRNNNSVVEIHSND